MKIPIEVIKALREETSAPIGDIRSALEASGGDPIKARDILRRRGAQIAQARQGRSTGQGRVESYVHHDGRLAAMVEVNCETDFVARTPEFIQFCRDLAMQVAAMEPRYLKTDEAPSSDEKDADELKASCLLEQAFVKDPGLTINDLLKELIAKTGENVVIRRFVRFALGQ